jgi:hypothetical protein
VFKHRLTLPALDGRQPLGFLASLGLLRLLSDETAEDTALSFSDTTAQAILHGPYSDLEAVVDVLGSVVKDMAADSLLPRVPGGYPLRKAGTRGGDPMRGERARHREAVELVRQVGGEEAVRWHTTLVTDLATDAKGNVALTPYSAPVGQQTVKSSFEKTLSLVRADPRHLHRALSGWRRVPGYTGEYLDHHVLRTAADLPLGDSSEIGVPGATWLALMALPMLRLTGDGTSVLASLWRRVARQRVMLWPLWRQPLDMPGVVTLIEHPAINVLSIEGTATGYDFSLRTDATHWPALGVFTVGAARRVTMDGRKSDGILVPTRVSVIVGRGGQSQSGAEP